MDESDPTPKRARLELVLPPPWQTLLRAELAAGVAEVPGSRDNPRIVDYHACTRGRGRFGDATHWCSSCLCWAFEQCGMPHPRSKRARDWLQWGEELLEPRLGCVMVLWRAPAGTPLALARRSPFGHVTLYEGLERDGRLRGLGGNQGNRLSIVPYARRRVLSFRWPAGYPLRP